MRSFDRFLPSNPTAFLITLSPFAPQWVQPTPPTPIKTSSVIVFIYGNEWASHLTIGKGSSVLFHRTQLHHFSINEQFPLDAEIVNKWQNDRIRIQLCAQASGFMTAWYRRHLARIVFLITTQNRICSFLTSDSHQPLMEKLTNLINRGI